MLFELVKGAISASLVAVGRKQDIYHRLEFWVHVLWEGQSPAQYVVEYLTTVLGMERGDADAHFIDDATKSPEVCEKARFIMLEHFWRNV